MQAQLNSTPAWGFSRRPSHQPTRRYANPRPIRPSFGFGANGLSSMMFLFQMMTAMSQMSQGWGNFMGGGQMGNGLPQSRQTMPSDIPFNQLPKLPEGEVWAKDVGGAPGLDTQKLPWVRMTQEQVLQMALRPSAGR